MFEISQSIRLKNTSRRYPIVLDRQTLKSCY